MDFKAARMAMVESQIRPNGVRDPRILNAFATVPRELFVPENQKALAYMDDAVLAAPASAGFPARHLLPPMVLARMLQFANPPAAGRVLDVGGVTGYSAAILARLCAKVYALELSESLGQRMKECLHDAGTGTVSVHTGPLNEGLAGDRPFDVIVVNGGVSKEPKLLLDQLAGGGRLVAIVRKGGWFGQAYLFTKSEGVVSGRPVFDAGAETLSGFEEKPQFVF